MKRWKCLPCAKRGSPEEWEDHRTESFCRQCGCPATRIVEFACFRCDDEGLRFWDVQAPSHPCPQCSEDCYRVVEAPYIGKSSCKSEDFKAADKLLETELANQGLSSTSLKRELPKVDERLLPRWAGANELLPAGGKGVGGKLPFDMPRPHTTIAGSFTGD